jgi:hypothetical protein
MLSELWYDVFDLVVIGLLALTVQFALEVHTATAGNLKTTHDTVTLA